MSNPAVSVPVVTTLPQARRMLAAGRVRRLVVLGADPRCPGILAGRSWH
jgi:CBS domain-containing protein